ncbi:chalcone isomerase family protein [Chitiniphilus purpureus]|uniref:Chalcone isomerase family protein n=1 Tax=Chitiniphilus purpureus TaxID=2981137 RepID=A0ABY6DQS8_9NEIS|nr:chalcone isomerase family protein [Chitiniphilus sp. CD1]UXY15836.1 chalcone isomerase family protein [Chitiniphilus sp. CD1]
MRALLLAMLLLCALPAWAGWRNDVVGARVVGEGQLRWLGLRIYTARLWSGSDPFSSEAPFALQLDYHRSISRERLAATSIDEIRRLFGGRYSEARLEGWRARMLQAFVDVQAGDRIVGVFQPGVGARFYAGERLTADIADPEFARAFFAIWLAPDTRDQALRAQLLGSAP